MAETRAQRRRQQQRAIGNRGRGLGRATASSQPARFLPPTLGHSGLPYDTQRLSPDSALRAKEGLGSDFFVDRLRSHETSDGTYYAFQLKKPTSVRIHNPTSSTNRVECTCGDRTPCGHVYWLFDGLRAVFNPRSNVSPCDVSDERRVADEISALYDLIGENIDTLPETLNATRGSEQDSDTDEEITDDASISHEAEARAAVATDMLSIFSRNQLPDEYGMELPATPIDGALEDVLIPENLAATIYGLAVREESFYLHLRRLINRDVCADHYLRKQRRRAQRAIAQLGQPSDNDPSIRVHECGDALRSIVREVCRDREMRTLKRPLDSRILNKAAELLVDILEDVCKHNKKIPRSKPSPASDVDANLFTYLISEPSPVEDGDFVIDQLRKLPQNEWRHLLEHLTTIADYVRNHAPERRYRSVRYADKIDAMVDEYTSSAFEPSSSSHQRPVSGSDRESQRRRYY